MPETCPLIKLHVLSHLVGFSTLHNVYDARSHEHQILIVFEHRPSEFKFQSYVLLITK
jgi:hypothetical protein